MDMDCPLLNDGGGLHALKVVTPPTSPQSG